VVLCGDAAGAAISRLSHGSPRDRGGAVSERLPLLGSRAIPWSREKRRRPRLVVMEHTKIQACMKLPKVFSVTKGL
jgi:hypothetical protein